MDDTEVICKASNLEMAMLEYFSNPTIEQHHAMQILTAKLQADMQIAAARNERRKAHNEMR